MADERHDAAQPEEPNELETEAEKPEERWTRLQELFRRLRTLIARLWGRAALALTWLRRPDEVGQSLTLQPRGVRLLVLLIDLRHAGRG